MCDYFILTKPKEVNTDKDDKNQVISFNEKAYILPKIILIIILIMDYLKKN